MWINKITQIRKDRYRIEPDDGFPFVLYKGELLKYGIEEDKELSDVVYQTIEKDVLLKRCKLRAMHLLEKEDRTEGQLRNKLEEGEYTPDVIDETVEFLYSFHYLDDSRFIKNYISYYGKTRSKAEIVRGLTLKGVSKDAIEDGFLQMEEEDESVQPVPDQVKIREYLEKKHFIWTEAEDKEKNRIYRHLLSKGFHSSDIMREMRQNRLP